MALDCPAWQEFVSLRDEETGSEVLFSGSLPKHLQVPGGTPVLEPSPAVQKPILCLVGQLWSLEEPGAPLAGQGTGARGPRACSLWFSQLPPPALLPFCSCALGWDLAPVGRLCSRAGLAEPWDPRVAREGVSLKSLCPRPPPLPAWGSRPCPCPVAASLPAGLTARSLPELQPWCRAWAATSTVKPMPAPTWGELRGGGPGLRCLCAGAPQRLWSSHPQDPFLTTEGLSLSPIHEGGASCLLDLMGR